MEEILHIDGDILPYKIGFVTTKKVYVIDEEGEHSCSPALITRSKARVNKWLKVSPNLLVNSFTYVESEFQAITALKKAIQSIVMGAKAKRFRVIISGDTNFRDEIATIQPYKGNRVDFEKPKHWKMLRDWLISMPYTAVTDNEEADDLLSRALMAGHPIATIDKDLNNTPGWHYNFNKKLMYHVTPEEARYNFYAQMLTGDTADHIPGIKGIGPVKAKKILQGCQSIKSYESKVFDQYQKVYDYPTAAMTEVGQLLWMRREVEEMWEPEFVKMGYGL